MTVIENTTFTCNAKTCALYITCNYLRKCNATLPLHFCITPCLCHREKFIAHLRNHDVLTSFDFASQPTHCHLHPRHDVTAAPLSTKIFM